MSDQLAVPSGLCESCGRNPCECKRLHVLAKSITDQISAENALVEKRTGWNMTAQAFFVGLAGLATKQEPSPSDLQLALVLIAFLGGSISFLALQSVNAAFEQIKSLQTIWDNDKAALERLGYVAPFGDEAAHRKGKWTPVGIPWVIKVFWSGVAILSILAAWK